MPPIIFFVIVIFIMSLLYGYVGWRIITPANFSASITVTLWIIVVFLLLTLILSFVLRANKYEGLLSDIISWVGYISFGFVTILFAFVFVKDIIWLTGIISHKIYLFAGSLFSSSTKTPALIDNSKREFLINSVNVGILAAAGGLTGWGFFNVMSKPKIERITIPIENLPDDLNGLTIAQFSDLHVGPTIQKSFVETVVKQVNDLNADIIAFTGDLVDGSVEALRKHVEPLTELKSKYGKYFITGNHEYYSGALDWVIEAERLKFTALINENRSIEIGNSKLMLAGVTDWTGGQFYNAHKSDPMKAAEANYTPDLKILLAHQPKSINAASKAGFQIQLSGHTHGGQYFPYTFMVKLDQPYIKGLHKHDNTWLYINKGTGYWGPPLRIGVPSEITLITITKA